MKLEINRAFKEVILIGIPVPSDKEILDKSYNDMQFFQSVKRRLKNDFVSFRVYLSTLGFREKFNGTDIIFYYTGSNFDLAVESATKLAVTTFALRDRIFDTPVIENTEPDTSNMNYGEILTKARKAKGWTQEQLSKRINVSVPALSRIEKGFSFKVETIKMICQVTDARIIVPDNIKFKK